MSLINYPKIGQTNDRKVFISFYIDNKKIRLYNGKRINSKVNPNDYPDNQRLHQANILAAEVYNYISKGGVLRTFRKQSAMIGKLSDLEYLNMALEDKLNESYSDKYKSTLQYIHRDIVNTCKGNVITLEDINSILSKYTSATSYNTLRRHLHALLNTAVSKGMEPRDLLSNKSRKNKAKLNKPFREIRPVLDEIRVFNDKLFLCCLLTYGCLLRPHREIRELCWGDFSSDLSQIHLSGHRNKSGRNRIVPVPVYIRENLVKGEDSKNIFSGELEPYNSDYFKSLWSKYKAQSKVLEEHQTLYSFRHTGAIDIFKRTGSLTKLQKAMGHSSLNVSLTYLRGLEVAELQEEDMPMIGPF
jgi:integrase